MRIPVLLTGLLFGLAALAQAPQGFSYQAVARATNGDPLAGQAVGVQFVLHQGNALGAVVFAETHATTTNAHGLFSLSVGGGTASAGTFSAIDWSAGPYFLEVGLDAGTTGSYVSMGTQQLMSVPYALYAGRSNVPDGTEVGQIAHWTGTAWAVDSGLYVHDKRFGIGIKTPEAPLGVKARNGLYARFQNGDIPSQDDFAFTSDSSGFGIDQGAPASLSSRFFIQASTGNVGMGTTQPTEKYFIHAIHNGHRVGLGMSNGAASSNTGWAMGHLDDAVVERNGSFTLVELGGTTESERLVVRSGGNVGINEKTPDTFLHVSRPAADPDALASFTPGSGLLTLGERSANLILDHQGIQARHLLGGATSMSGSGLNLQRLGGELLVHGDATTDAEKVIVRSDGKMGVGVLVPMEKLHVNGRVIIGDSPNEAPMNGTIRYNAGSGDLEGFVANAWTSLGSKWEKVDNSTTPTASKITYNPAKAMVGIGVAQPMSALHVRGHEQCDDGSVSLLIENPTATLSADASATRVGMQITCTGVWSSNVAAKSIGLVSSASGAGNANANLAAVLNGNVVVGSVQGEMVGSNGANVLAIQNGAPPAAPVGASLGATDGGIQVYSAMDVSGVSQLHVMNGDGTVMRLYRAPALTAADPSPVGGSVDPGTAALIQNMRTRIDELESRLKAFGLLVP